MPGIQRNTASAAGGFLFLLLLFESPCTRRHCRVTFLLFLGKEQQWGVPCDCHDNSLALGHLTIPQLPNRLPHTTHPPPLASAIVNSTSDKAAISTNQPLQRPIWQARLIPKPEIADQHCMFISGGQRHRSGPIAQPLDPRRHVSTLRLPGALQACVSQPTPRPP